MKRYLVALFALSVLTALLFPANICAQENFASSDSGIILFMNGDVKVKSSKSDTWMDAQKGMIVSNGDNIKTGAVSWAELGFGKDFKNSVRIQENSHVILTDLGAIKINLIQGELRSLVEKLSKNTLFEIRTPVSVCGVRGTGWDTMTDGKTAEADVYENSVFFSGLSGQGSTIDSGKRGLLDQAGLLSIEDLPLDKINDWNKWKEDFSERRDVGTGAGSSGNPNMEEQVNAAESHQGAMEGMDKGKNAIFESDENREIDKKVEPGSGGSPGIGPY